MGSFLHWLKGGLWNRAYNQVGDALFLVEREHLEVAEISSDCPQEIVNEVLELVCESFDIPERQMGQLREGGRIWTIYESIRASSFHDDMELERLSTAIEERVQGFEMTSEFLQHATVGDLFQLLAKQNEET